MAAAISLSSLRKQGPITTGTRCLTRWGHSLRKTISCGYGSRIALAGRSLVRDDNGICRHDFKQPKAFSRHDLPEFCNFVVPLLPKGRRESRAPIAPAAPRAMRAENAHGLDRYSRDIPASPAQWLYGLYVLSPVSGVYCHRCRTRYETGWIDATVAAPGPHDFAVRCRRFAWRANPPDAAASIATRANVP